jgi:predicted nucleic acid-binding protein
MGYLLDTNILSELRKGERADKNVLVWAEQIHRDRQVISVLSFGEIEKGIRIIKRRDVDQAIVLTHWKNQLQQIFANETVPVCSRIAQKWGEISAQRSLPVIDGLLAATALVHHLTLATRNIRDFSGLDLKIVNPFED